MKYLGPYLVEEEFKKPNYSRRNTNAIAKKIGLDFKKEGINPKEFEMGVEVEMEHSRLFTDETAVIKNEEEAGKVAWAHLKELPNYYSRLDKMEKEGKNGNRS